MSGKYFYRQWKSVRQRTAESHFFALYTPDVYYSIQVYKNPDPGEPESGTAMFSSKQYGSTTYSGYYTIPLKTQPVFQEGDTFSVVLTFRGKNQSYVDTFVDYTSNTAGIQFRSSATAGQSFYKSSGTWKDMTRIGNKSAVARIKAFTKDTAAAATSGTGSGSSGTVQYFHTKDPYLPLPGLQQRLSFLDSSQRCYRL